MLAVVSPKEEDAVLTALHARVPAVELPPIPKPRMTDRWTATPDPNIGKRIGAGRGININDADGFERTDYGMLTVAGNDRVVLGLDGKDGEEAVVM